MTGGPWKTWGNEFQFSWAEGPLQQLWGLGDIFSGKSPWVIIGGAELSPMSKQPRTALEGWFPGPGSPGPCTVIGRGRLLTIYSGWVPLDNVIWGPGLMSSE